MVEIARRGQAEQFLQQAVDGGGSKKIPAAHDMGDPLPGIVQHHREVIARRAILAHQHDIAPALRGAGHAMEPRERGILRLGPIERRHPPERRVHVEPQSEGFPARDARAARGLREVAAGAGVERRTIGIAPRRAGNSTARAEAGIKQALRVQICRHGGIAGEMRGLAQHRPFPLQPQPFEILKAGGNHVGPAAGKVDILDPEQKHAPRPAREFGIQQGAIGMPGMKIAVRTGRESENGLHRARLPGTGVLRNHAGPGGGEKAMILHDENDVARGAEELARRCPHMAKIHALCGVPPLRWREPGFGGLVSTITAQQLSTSSAQAIRTRLRALADPITPETLLALDEAALRGCGYSAPKIRTLRAIAAAILDGTLPFERLAQMPADEACAAMVRIHGIGPWTAQVWMMFCLGTQDIFAPGDLALQEGAKLALGLAQRPGTRELERIALRWAPWRAVAARMLWAYYAHEKKRAGVVTN